MPNVSLVQRTVIPDRKYRGRRGDYDDWIKQAPLDNQMALRVEFEDMKKAHALFYALRGRKEKHRRNRWPFPPVYLHPEMTGLKFARRGNIVFLWREEER